MSTPKCSTCQRCTNRYCHFFKRPVELTENSCLKHTDLDKETPLNREYVSPSQKELDIEMEKNHKIPQFKIITLMIGDKKWI